MDMEMQRRALRVAYRNFFIALSGMVVLASLLVLPPTTFIVGWLNASVTAIGPMTSLFLIPTVVGFVSLLGIGRLRLLRERWMVRRMAWGAAWGAVGGIALTWANAWIDQREPSSFATLQIALYMVIVAMLAVVFAPGVPPAPER